MEEDITDLYAAMTTERVSVEMMFGPGRSGDTLVTCRLRPWKSGRNGDRMILAGGYSLDEALAYAYTGMVDQTWLPVDWSARAMEKGVVMTVAVTPDKPGGDPGLKRRLEGLYGPKTTGGTASRRKVSQNGAEEHSDQTG